jgi:hypothetical protein
VFSGTYFFADDFSFEHVLSFSAFRSESALPQRDGRTTEDGAQM